MEHDWEIKLLISSACCRFVLERKLLSSYNSRSIGFTYVSILICWDIYGQIFHNYLTYSGWITKF